MDRSIRMQMVSFALTSLVSGCDDGAAPDTGPETPGIDAEGETPAADGDGEAPAARAQISEYVRGLGQLKVADPVPLTKMQCEPKGELCGEVVEGEQLCIYSRYTLTERFDKFVAFQPNSATLWPGVVVEGADAREGSTPATRSS